MPSRVDRQVRYPEESESEGNGKPEAKWPEEAFTACMMMIRGSLMQPCLRLLAGRVITPKNSTEAEQFMHERGRRSLGESNGPCRNPEEEEVNGSGSAYIEGCDQVLIFQSGLPVAQLLTLSNDTPKRYYS